MSDRKSLYDLWRGMHKRCSDAAHISYPYYGAKGVSVCERWASFDAFVTDVSPRPSGMTLDRINGMKGYSPENCRWATLAEQNRNKRNTILVARNGEVKPVGAWARELGISPQVVHYRMRKMGLSAEAALSVPASRTARYLIDWTLLRQREAA